jgi:hypothetical protein
MSWWFVRKREDGRRTLWIVDLEPMAILSLLAMLVTILAVKGFVSLTLLVGGFICFFVSKLSVIRRGVSISWGPRLMTARYGRLYKVGYLLMVIGAFWCLLVPYWVWRCGYERA